MDIQHLVLDTIPNEEQRKITDQSLTLPTSLSFTRIALTPKTSTYCYMVEGSVHHRSLVLTGLSIYEPVDLLQNNHVTLDQYMEVMELRLEIPISLVNRSGEGQIGFKGQYRGDIGYVIGSDQQTLSIGVCYKEHNPLEFMMTVRGTWGQNGISRIIVPKIAVRGK